MSTIAAPRTRLRSFSLTVPGVIVAMTVLMVASAWLRSRGIHGRFWIDEGISVGISSHPITDIPGLLHQDGSPPAYYLLLHVWMALIGRGEARTHALSFGFALLTIPTAFLLAREIFGLDAHGSHCPGATRSGHAPSICTSWGSSGSAPRSTTPTVT